MQPLCFLTIVKPSFFLIVQQYKMYKCLPVSSSSKLINNEVYVKITRMLTVDTESTLTWLKTHSRYYTHTFPHA